MIILGFIRHYNQLLAHLSQLEKLDFVTDDLKSLRDAIVDAISHNVPLTVAVLRGI